MIQEYLGSDLENITVISALPMTEAKEYLSLE